MMIEPGEESMSLDAVALAWRRENEVNAAAAAREVVEEMVAAGIRVTSGTLAGIELRLLNMLNQQLEHDLAQIAQRMRESLQPPPTVH
jgi:predicted Rossmann fold nucleotide-binding protein DprA/Smf involved in DNA uptake